MIKLKIDSYEKILNTIIEGIAIIDIREHLIYCNEAFLALTGFSEEDLNDGQVALKNFPREDQDAIRYILKTGVNGQEFVLQTTVSNKKNGHRKPVICRIYIVEDTDSSIKQLCIALSSLKDLEENDPNGVPREIAALRKAFISNVSHELRTPVAIIREAVSLLGDATLGELNDSQLHFVGMALKNIDRLTNIINHLLDLALFEKNSVDVVIEPVDLKVLIAQLQKKYCQVAEQKSLLVDWQCEDPLPDMMTDGKKLLYILNNLIKNAIQFSEKDGAVIVNVKKSADGKNVCILVKDTGCGIPASEVEKIFDMFYQSNRVPGPGERGVGIGLAIVHRLTQLLKGQVEVESVEGSGATFRVTIPTIYE